MDEVELDDVDPITDVEIDFGTPITNTDEIE